MKLVSEDGLAVAVTVKDVRLESTEDAFETGEFTGEPMHAYM